MKKGNFLWIALLLLMGCQADRLTKEWAESRLKDSPSLTVVPQVLEFRYAENRAIAFSMLHNLSPRMRTPLVFSLSGIAFAALLSFAWASRRLGLSRLLPIALILAGALGNLQDRVLRGYVIDFVRVHWKESWSFAVFNVADSLITVGVTLLILQSLFRRGPLRRDHPPVAPSA
jgi:signal peptidase II